MCFICEPREKLKCIVSYRFYVFQTAHERTLTYALDLHMNLIVLTVVFAFVIIVVFRPYMYILYCKLKIQKLFRTHVPDMYLKLKSLRITDLCAILATRMKNVYHRIALAKGLNDGF